LGCRFTKADGTVKPAASNDGQAEKRPTSDNKACTILLLVEPSDVSIISLLLIPLFSTDETAAVGGSITGSNKSGALSLLVASDLAFLEAGFFAATAVVEVTAAAALARLLVELLLLPVGAIATVAAAAAAERRVVTVMVDVVACVYGLRRQGFWVCAPARPRLARESESRDKRYVYQYDTIND
jgi:hypothetical protein